MTDRANLQLDEYSSVSLKDSLNRHTLSKSNYVNATVTSSASNFSSAGTLNDLSTNSNNKLFDGIQAVSLSSPASTASSRDQWSRPSNLPNSGPAATLAMSSSLRDSSATCSFLEARYGGEEGYRRHRNERMAQNPTLQRYSEHEGSVNLQSRQKSAATAARVEFGKQNGSVKGNSNHIQFAEVQDRTFPALDLTLYNCLNTSEFKAGPFYEDCLYDDDEMKLSSLLEHGVMFEPVKPVETSEVPFFRA